MTAVLYCRYSSESQTENSIEGQIRDCQEYAERNNMTIVATYIDRALSARSSDRPEFQRMIRDSAKKQFQAVLVWKLDRFSRNRFDSATYRAVLKRNGVNVISVKENISDGPEGIILEAMLEGMAEYYSAELSVKVKRGQKENALKGIYNGGGMLFGYKVGTDRTYEIDPVAAPIVKEIFQRYADGDSANEIITSLKERGALRGTNKEGVRNSGIHVMLKNRRYIGEYRYQDVVIPDGIPAIIEQDLFDRVQERMKKNKHAPASKKAEDEYILTTKIFCGLCGALMVGESGRSRNGTVHYYYKCGTAKHKHACPKKTVKKDYIERLVVVETQRLIFQGDTVERIAEAVVALQGKENTAIPLLERLLQETKKGIENILNAIQQGIITLSTKQRLSELEARKEELEINIAQEQLEKPLLTKEQVIDWISRFKGGDVDDPVYRKTIIDVFVNAVYLYDDRFILTYNHKDGTRTIPLSEFGGSDFETVPPPVGIAIRGRNVFYGYSFVFQRESTSPFG